MATVRETTSGSQDLATFQLVVQQQEGIFGPLLSLSNDQGQNIMEFRVGLSPDADHRAVLKTYTDHPPVKEGHTLICIGACSVAGILSQVAAYRKST